MRPYAAYVWPGGTFGIVTGCATTETTTTTFGPATIRIADCPPETFFVQADTQNVNTNTDTFLLRIASPPSRGPPPQYQRGA